MGSAVSWKGHTASKEGNHWGPRKCVLFRNKKSGCLTQDSSSEEIKLEMRIPQGRDHDKNSCLSVGNSGHLHLRNTCLFLLKNKSFF